MHPLRQPSCPSLACVLWLLLPASAHAQGILYRWPSTEPGRAAAATAGDVDADGVADFAVGKASYFVLGSVHARSGVDGTELWRAAGANVGDQFGLALAALGDVDDDGRADLAVAASPTATAPAYVRALSGLDGGVLWHADGPGLESAFGAALARAGDLDGDGVSELLVGAPRVAFDAPGEVYVLSGASGALLFPIAGDVGRDGFGRDVAGARDLDGDGIDDLLVGDDSGSAGRVTARSGADGSVLFAIDGPVSFGAALAWVPDANGDGVGDILVGAPYEPITPPAVSGRVYLHSGAGGALLHAVDGGTTRSFGSSVAPLDDLDGDGVTDHLISAGFYLTGCCTVFIAEARVHSGASGALLSYGEPGQADGPAPVPDANGDGRRDFLVASTFDVDGRAAVLALTGWSSPSSYTCPSMPTADGCYPYITVSGPPSLTLGGDLVLRAWGLPSGTTGLYAWSHATTSVPFGLDGTLCLAPPIRRFPPLVATSGEPGCQPGSDSGTLVHTLDKPELAALGLAPGELFVLQAWYRDPGFPAPESERLTAGAIVTIWP